MGISALSVGMGPAWPSRQHPQCRLTRMAVNGTYLSGQRSSRRESSEPESEGRITVLQDVEPQHASSPTRHRAVTSRTFMMGGMLLFTLPSGGVRMSGAERPTSGAVYIATGAKWVHEAKASAMTLARHHPWMPIVLWTDDPGSVGTESPFAKVEILEDPVYGMGDSIVRPEMLIFDKTLLLDTDTVVLGDLSPVLHILDHWDLAARPSPGRVRVRGLPDVVTEFNTGVLALRHNSAVLMFLDDWRRRFLERAVDQGREGAGRNQSTFTEALHFSGLRIWPLPPEYNLRLRQAELLQRQVRVLHGRHRRDLANIGRRLNRRTGSRLMWFLPVTKYRGPILTIPCPRRAPFDALRHVLVRRLPLRVRQARPVRRVRN